MVAFQLPHIKFIAKSGKYRILFQTQIVFCFSCKVISEEDDKMNKVEWTGKAEIRQNTWQ